VRSGLARYVFPVFKKLITLKEVGDDFATSFERMAYADDDGALALQGATRSYWYRLLGAADADEGGEEGILPRMLDADTAIVNKDEVSFDVISDFIKTFHPEAKTGKISDRYQVTDGLAASNQAIGPGARGAWSAALAQHGYTAATIDHDYVTLTIAHNNVKVASVPHNLQPGDRLRLLPTVAYGAVTNSYCPIAAGPVQENAVFCYFNGAALVDVGTSCVYDGVHWPHFHWAAAYLAATPVTFRCEVIRYGFEGVVGDLLDRAVPEAWMKRVAKFDSVIDIMNEVFTPAELQAAFNTRRKAVLPMPVGLLTRPTNWFSKVLDNAHQDLADVQADYLVMFTIWVDCLRVMGTAPDMYDKLEGRHF
jgi:hypothetical protein